MSTTTVMTEGYWEEVPVARREKSLRDQVEGAGGIVYIFSIFIISTSVMSAFREIRSILLQSFDDGEISENEFLLLYDVNTSKNPDFPYESYGKFDLNDMDDSECLFEFCFRKSDLPVLSEALRLSNYFTRQQGTICDGIKGLCIALRRFAYPCRLSD